MPDQVDRIFEELRNALTVTNAAVRPNAPHTFRITAGRALHRALRLTVDSDAFWAELTARAVTPKLDCFSLLDAVRLKDLLEELITVRQVVLLQATGYEDDPPPSPFDLIEATRKAITSDAIAPEEIARVRSQLRAFVIQFGKRGTRGESSAWRRWLQSARAIAANILPLTAKSVTAGVNFGVVHAEAEFARRSTTDTTPMSSAPIASLSNIETARRMSDALAAAALLRSLGQQLAPELAVSLDRGERSGAREASSSHPGDRRAAPDLGRPPRELPPLSL